MSVPPVEDRGAQCSVLSYVAEATSRMQLQRFVAGDATLDGVTAR